MVTTLCPGGKERMRRLIRIIESGHFDPLPPHHSPVRARRHRRSLRPLQQTVATACWTWRSPR